MVSAASPQKRGFDILACAKKRGPEPAPKIPRAADIKTPTPGKVNFSAKPPQNVLERLGDPPVTVGFDIEALSSSIEHRCPI